MYCLLDNLYICSPKTAGYLPCRTGRAQMVTGPNRTIRSSGERRIHNPEVSVLKENMAG